MNLSCCILTATLPHTTDQCSLLQAGYMTYRAYSITSLPIRKDTRRLGFSRAAKNQHEFMRAMTRGAAKFEVPAGPYALTPVDLARRLWLSAELFQLPTEHALN